MENDAQLTALINEIRNEQHISDCETDEVIKSYVKDGIYDINKNVGAKINYEKDLKARRLLKNFVLYVRYQRLAEFKELYGGDILELQIEYYEATNI